MEDDKDSKAKAAAEQLELQSQVCTATARSLLEQESEEVKKTIHKNEDSADSQQQQEDSASIASSSPSMVDMNDLFTLYDNILDPTTNLLDLYHAINSAIGTMARPCPVTTSVAPNVPMTVTAEDLLLFRVGLGLVMYGMSTMESQSQQQQENSALQWSMSMANPHTLELACTLPQRLVPVNLTTSNALLFRKDAHLRSIVSMVKALSGNFGTRKVRATDGSFLVVWIQLPVLQAYGEETIGTSTSSSQKTKRFSATGQADLHLPEDTVLGRHITTTKSTCSGGGRAGCTTTTTSSAAAWRSNVTKVRNHVSLPQYFL